MYMQMRAGKLLKPELLVTTACQPNITSLSPAVTISSSSSCCSSRSSFIIPVIIIIIINNNNNNNRCTMTMP